MEKPSLRQRLAQNLALLMEVHPSLDTQVKVAKRSGLAQSTVGRILRCEVAATLDNIEALADAFGLDATTLVKKCGESVSVLDTKLTGLSESDLQQIRAFVDFVAAQREAHTVGGIALTGQITPETNQAQVIRAMQRPLSDETFNRDDTRPPAEKKEIRLAARKRNPRR